MILRNENGLKSPYSRIIFGLSLGDMIYSLGLIFGPIAAPKDTPMKLWAKGNVETCEFIGFLFNFMSTVPFYSAFLTYYFYQRVIRKVKPTLFAKKYEPYLHVLTWAYPFIGGFVGLALDLFNPSRRGSMCIMAESPLHCNDDPSVECTRGIENAFMIGSIYQVLIPFVVGFSCVVVNLTRFTLYIYREEKRMLNDANSRMKRRKSNDDGVEMQEHNRENNADNADEENLSAAEAIDQEKKPDDSVPYELARQALVQSSLYIAAFVLCYSVPVIAAIMRAAMGNISDFWFILISLFSPLLGFFNILIYTRPKIQSVRKSFPQYEDSLWIKVFFLVIVNGGEVPDAMEEQKIGTPGKNDNEKDLRRYEELDKVRFSSKENFGRAALSGNALKSTLSQTKDMKGLYKDVIIPSIHREKGLDDFPRASAFGFTGVYKDVKLPLSRNSLAKINSEESIGGGEERKVSGKILNKSLSGLESIQEENDINI